MFNICIDPGHGGSEPGTKTKNGVSEKHWNLEVAKEVKVFLDQYKDFKTELTRYTDTYLDLNTRSDIANIMGANLFVSIHHNAGGGDGYEVYFYKGSDKGNKLANLISAEFVKMNNKRYVGSTIRAGSGSGSYAVLRNTNMPAVLTEFAFLDTDDVKSVDTFFERQAEGFAIARAILGYFGVPEKIKKEYVPECENLKNKLIDIRNTIDKLVLDLK